MKTKVLVDIYQMAIAIAYNDSNMQSAFFNEFVYHYNKTMNNDDLTIERQNCHVCHELNEKAKKFFLEMAGMIQAGGEE